VTQRERKRERISLSLLAVTRMSGQSFICSRLPTANRRARILIPVSTIRIVLIPDDMNNAWE